MKVLVLNSGSDALRYKLFDMSTERELASGAVDRIGKTGSKIVHRAGEVTVERDDFTGARPGRLIRGPQASPF